MSLSTAAQEARPQYLTADQWGLRALVLTLLALLSVFMALPLLAMLRKSLEDPNGNFVGLANYIAYFSTPALSGSLWNSLFVSTVTTVE